MKKLIFTLLIFASVQANAFMFSIWSIENDTTTEGVTFTLRVNGNAIGATDTGRVYINLLSSGAFKEVFKINLNQIATLPADNGARRITITIPATGFKGACKFTTNNDNTVLYNVFLRSATPDLFPVASGPFSGPSGFSTYLKFKWTYQASNTDTLRIYQDGIEIAKKSLKQMEADSTIYYTVSGSPGEKIITINMGDITEFLRTIDQPISTDIVKPYEYESNESISYFNILGQPVTPKYGDLIRLTPYGAVIISQ